MYNAKNYTEKLPKSIRKPLTAFTQNDCLLVTKLNDDFGLERRALNCHVNVSGYVEKFGGEMVNGWLLYRNKRLLNVGMWVWSFHSVWLTEDKKLFDVTDDSQYATNSFTTFIPDANRKVDFENGINYNNIVIFENEAFAKHWGKSTQTEVEANTLYWVTDDMMRIKKITEHSGMYRWLTDSYPNNIQLLKEKYGVVINNNKLMVTEAANDADIENAMFDFSLSAA
jgi:hypothetical protein